LTWLERQPINSDVLRSCKPRVGEVVVEGQQRMSTTPDGLAHLRHELRTLNHIIGFSGRPHRQDHGRTEQARPRSHAGEL